MPITISIPPQNVDASGRNLVYAIGTLTFSGSYPSGGETLDLSLVADRLASSQILRIFVDSQSGNVQTQYRAILGPDMRTGKLKIFNAAGTEQSGAYASPVTTDVVQITIIARKLH
jgi:hypothetical protein